MVSPICKGRLMKEYKSIQGNPPENIVATPLENNILEWHYVIRGVAGPYKGGYYWGKLKFPPEYPLKPPSIMMTTPNGRFHTDTRLCLSMSDFHPESWNPLWSVSTILMGLYAFMLESSPTAGSVETTEATKKRCARESLDFNLKSKLFCELFPDLVEEMTRIKETRPQIEIRPQTAEHKTGSADTTSCVHLVMALGLVIALLAICLRVS